MRPDGTVDNTCIQSREVWTGTTYTTAATMIFESKFSTQVATADILASELDSPVVDYSQPNNDMLMKGFATAKGIHDGGWNLFGYQFATPEAYEASGNYRSLGYMRALAVWSIQYSLEKKN
jgi:non-lysosomal glucosylceramidase